MGLSVIIVTIILQRSQARRSAAGIPALCGERGIGFPRDKTSKKVPYHLKFQPNQSKRANRNPRYLQG